MRLIQRYIFSFAHWRGGGEFGGHLRCVGAAANDVICMSYIIYFTKKLPSLSNSKWTVLHYLHRTTVSLWTILVSLSALTQIVLLQLEAAKESVLCKGLQKREKKKEKF